MFILQAIHDDHEFHERSICIWPQIAPQAPMRGADSQPSGVMDGPSPTNFPWDPNPVPG